MILTYCLIAAFISFCWGLSDDLPCGLEGVIAGLFWPLTIAYVLGYKTGAHLESRRDAIVERRRAREAQK